MDPSDTHRNWTCHGWIAGLCAALLSGACSGAPPPAEVPEAVPASEGIAEQTSPLPPATAPVDYERALAPTVKVVGVMPSTESTEYVRVQLEFTNPNDHPCGIEGYSVFWGEHLKKVDMQDLVLSGNQTRERRLKVHPHDGDLDALTVESASAKVLGGCKPAG